MARAIYRATERVTRYTIRVTETADADRDEMADFTADDNPAAAEKWVVEVNRKIDRLSDFPRLGQARPELCPDLRTVTVGRYVICYRVSDDEAVVGISRIFHAARDFPAIFR